jgi:hypothetical protein
LYDNRFFWFVGQEFVYGEVTPRPRRVTRNQLHRVDEAEPGELRSNASQGGCFETANAFLRVRSPARAISFSTLSSNP